MYLVTYSKYLYFNYLTTVQTDTQNNLWFFSFFTSGSFSLAKYTKLCMFWQPNLRNML